MEDFACRVMALSSNVRSAGTGQRFGAVCKGDRKTGPGLLPDADAGPSVTGCRLVTGSTVALDACSGESVSFIQRHRAPMSRLGLNADERALVAQMALS